MLFSSTQISQKSSRSSSGRWRCASYRQVEPISRSNPPEAPEDTIQHAAENLWPSAVCKCGLLKNSECTDSRGASRDNYTMHRVHIINKLETESFLCVKCCFISVWVKQKKEKNMVDFRHSSRFMQETRHYLRRGEYLCRGSLRVERNQTFSLCFYFSGELGKLCW